MIDEAKFDNWVADADRLRMRIVSVLPASKNLYNSGPSVRVSESNDYCIAGGRRGVF